MAVPARARANVRRVDRAPGPLDLHACAGLDPPSFAHPALPAPATPLFARSSSSRAPSMSSGSYNFSSEPQPRTIAPSREDVLSNLMYFFGAPVSPEKLKDYSEHHAMTYHFPDAYAGSNTKSPPPPS